MPELTDHSKRAILGHASSTASFQALDKKAVDIVAALRTGEDRQLEMVVRSSDSQKQLDDKLSDLQDIVHKSTDRFDSRFDGLAQQLADISQPKAKKHFVNSLFFPQYRYRQDNVSKPWSKTFEL